jgi:uncharacterized protein YyaL (SSP411 family)
MQWHSFQSEIRAEAEERGLPLFLLLVAPWCERSRALRSQLEAHPAAAALCGERFVPVLVDKDVDPALDARFRTQGWPTALLLTPEGEVLEELPVGDANELLQALADAAPRGLTPRARRAGPRRADTAPDGLGAPLVERVVTTLIETADPVHGGWGARHKFPHPEALHLLVVRWSQTGDPRTLDTVLRTLRSMQAGAIHDRVEGGFYRFSRGADWSVPQTEKPLESNAKRMLAYIEAYQAFGEEGFKATALGILGWMRRTLLDPATGAFGAGQDEDDVYANIATPEARARHGAPKVDPRIVTDRNAAAVIALLKVSVVLGDGDALDLALRALDFLLEHLWDRELGAAHFWNGAWNQPGFLCDQGALLRALVEAVHCAGANRYLEPARALARTALRDLTDDDGGFRASAYAAPRGGRAREDRELVENAVLAEALIRLGHLVREPELIARGRAALASFAHDHLRFGFDAAAYGRAVDLCVHPPVHVTIVGRSDDPVARAQTMALRAAALRPYVASRIVQSIDPLAEPELFARTGLPRLRGGAPARAYVAQGERSYAETSDAHRLPALMARTERSN